MARVRANVFSNRLLFCHLARAAFLAEADLSSLVIFAALAGFFEAGRRRYRILGTGSYLPLLWKMREIRCSLESGVPNGIS